MRNEDLKNKLDQRPIEFDREALWERIDAQPDRKNRLFVWWWIGGLALFLIGIYYSVGYLSRPVQETNVAVVFDEKYNLNHESDGNSIGDLKSEIQELEIGNEELFAASEVERDVVTKTILETNLNHAKSGIQKKSSWKNNEKYSSENEVDFKVNRDRGSREQELDMIYKSDESITLNERVQKTLQITITNEKGISEEIDAIIDVNPIAVLGRFRLIYDREKVENIDNWIRNVQTPRIIWSDNGFAINIGLGSDFHRFESDSKYRRSELESNLEGVFAQISYQKYITKNWILSLGVGYITSQTKVELTSLDDTQYTRSVQDGNTYITTTETSRRLYNRYSRWDADISVGYEMRLSDWSFTPLIGRGISLKSTYDGDLITSNNEVLSLEGFPIYKDKLKGYWTAGLRIDKSINYGLRLGLLGRVESSRLLTDFDHKHSIVPVSIRLQMEWLW